MTLLPHLLLFQVNYAGPHPPLDVTERMKTSVQDRQFAAAANSTIEADSQLWMRRLYGAQIENIDQWTGKLVDHLASTSELERTIVCVSSDHGEMLGDHTVLGKESPFQVGDLQRSVEGPRGAREVAQKPGNPMHVAPATEMGGCVRTR